MNVIDFALNRPKTVMVAMVAIALGSVFAATRMRTDVFPELNMPIIYVAQAYGGMDSAQMEGLIANYYEYAFLYMNGIDHVETKNIQNMTLVKLYFHPGTDMAQAMAEAAIYANRAKAYFPPGTVSPFILRLDASSVPVSYLVLSSETRSISELSDLMLFRIRPILASLPGASAPQPFGGSLRTIVVHLDPERLRAYRLSPQEVAEALSKGNTITPSGDARIKDMMPIVSINSLVVDPQDLGKIAVKPGQSIYLRDLGRVEDSSDIPFGWALVNGRRSIYMPINKTAEASTLTVVGELRDNLDRMRKALPEDVKLTLEFDQSPYVTGAIGGVVEESALGALLTGLMVLLFLRDWRSVIIVVLTIPLALMGAVLGLWIAGQTINLMTLGGLSLAVGVLVDESTVAVENIHVQMGKSPSIARAVLIGTTETMVPRLLAMLCIIAVFVPSFLMEGAARNLFVPLSFSVGFAMVSSYFLSSTFVPVASVWLLRHSHADYHGRLFFPHRFFQWLLLGSRWLKAITPAAFFPAQPVHWLIRRLVLGGRVTAERFTFIRFQGRYSLLLVRLLSWRWILLPAYLVVAALVLGLVGSQVGREIAPQVDSGQFQMRIRAPSGTRLELTEEITREALEIIKKKVGPENIDMSVAYVGVTAPTYTVNTIYLWTGGVDQAVMRIALRKDSGLRVAKLKEDLRKELPERLEPWLAHRLETEYQYSAAQAKGRASQMRFSFEPADVVNQVMSFGSPTPVEVVVSGPNLAVNQAHAKKIYAGLKQIESLRDLQFAQVMDYPRIRVEVDRERIGFAKLTVADAANAMIAATSSTRYMVPVFWADPKSGIGYQVQLEVPPARINSFDEVGMIPIKPQADGGQVLMRDMARIKAGTMPEEYSRLNQKRYISLSANIEGEDLGRVSAKLAQALADAGELPRGVEVEIRGQVTPMLQMFHGLAVGLGLAVIAVFLMLAAYFQSVRMAIVATATTPAVVAGVAVALFITNTTLNIESFMGAIMCVGVAVANAILLVTFAERNRQKGETSLHAALSGARERLRPILMTSCAMIAGMVPMALGMGEGGEQTAPLGRAVIGGLIAATFATLLILPAIFAVVLGKSKARSASVHPDNPESAHFSPSAASSHAKDSIDAARAIYHAKGE
jgi:multidrug efflux pump subunit AcrB